MLSSNVPPITKTVKLSKNIITITQADIRNRKSGRNATVLIQLYVCFSMGSRVHVAPDRMAAIEMTVETTVNQERSSCVPYAFSNLICEEPVVQENNKVMLGKFDFVLVNIGR